MLLSALKLQIIGKIITFIIIITIIIIIIIIIIINIITVNNPCKRMLTLVKSDSNE